MKKNKLPKWNLDEIYVGHNDPKIDKAITNTGKAVENIPFAKPEMMFVAEPVSLEAATSCEGF